MSYFDKKKLALEVPIERILEHEGIELTRRCCRSPFRDEVTPSFRVYPETNTWCDFGLADSHMSGDGINLVQRIRNCGFKEAVDYILSLSGNGVPARRPARSRKGDGRLCQGTGHTVDSVSAISHPALVGYVRSRGIPLEVANRYCSEVHYTHVESGRKYFGIGFRNDNGGWAVRTAPGKQDGGFKGDILASGITTIRLADGKVTESAYLFEGFFNFLSWIVLYGDVDRDAFVLNSANNARAMRDLSGTGTKEILFFRDNDDCGMHAFEVVAGCSGCEVADGSGIYSVKGLNDLNDYLCSLEDKA